MASGRKRGSGRPGSRRGRGRPSTGPPRQPLQVAPPASTIASTSTQPTQQSLLPSMPARPSTRSIPSAQTEGRPPSEEPLNPESEEEQDQIGGTSNQDEEPQSDIEDDEPTRPVLRSANNPPRSALNSTTTAVSSMNQASTRPNSSSNTRPVSSTFQATEVQLPSSMNGHSRRNSSLFGPAQLPLPRPQVQQTQPIPSTIQSFPPQLLAHLFSMTPPPSSRQLLPGHTGGAPQQASPALTTVSLPASQEVSVTPSAPEVSGPPRSRQKRTQDNLTSHEDEAEKERQRKEKKKKHNDARPRRSDYNTDATLKDLLDLAITYMKIETSTVSPFPDKQLRLDKSNLFFSRALQDLELSSNAYILDVQQLRMIKAEDGNTRSAVKRAVDPLVAGHYGLIAGPTPQEAQANKGRVAFLLENSRFHCKDLNTGLGMFQNDLIAEAVMAAWFSHRNALGCLHQEHFKPIPLQSIALILTIIRHSLSQWAETGKCEKRSLLIDEYIFYDDFLEAMHCYQDHSPASAQALQSYRMRLFKRALASSGVEESTLHKPVIQITDEAMEAEMEWQERQDPPEDDDFA